MQELRLLLISLATVLLSSILLFIYFKTRISKVEEKLEIMFNLIQSHAQEKQLSPQQFVPYDNNVVNSEENKRINLIDVSDNDDEEDESDSNDSDTDSDDDNDLIIDNNSIVEEDNIKKIELTLDNKDVLFDDTLNEENLSHLEKLQDQIIVQKEDDDDNNDDDDDNNDDDDDDNEEEDVQETVDLSKLRVVELRKLCSDMGKSGYKSLKKQELIALLQN